MTRHAETMMHDVLRTLRVFGPCSNADVARRLGVSLDATYRAIKQLENDGLAVHPKLQVWDVSRLGREWLEKNGATVTKPRLFVETK